MLFQNTKGNKIIYIYLAKLLIRNIKGIGVFIFIFYLIYLYLSGRRIFWPTGSEVITRFVLTFSWEGASTERRSKHVRTSKVGKWRR